MIWFMILTAFPSRRNLLDFALSTQNILLRDMKLPSFGDVQVAVKSIVYNQYCYNSSWMVWYFFLFDIGIWYHSSTDSYTAICLYQLEFRKLGA